MNCLKYVIFFVCLFSSQGNDQREVPEHLGEAQEVTCYGFFIFLQATVNLGLQGESHLCLPTCPELVQIFPTMFKDFQYSTFNTEMEQSAHSPQLPVV